MDKIFDSVDAFIAELKAKSVNATSSASAALRYAADWIDQQSSGVKFAASPEQATKLEWCCDNLEVCIEECENDVMESEVVIPKRTKNAATPANFDPATFLMIAQMVMAVLKAIRERRKA